MNCECCGRGGFSDLPYHHDNHNPPYDGYDYCEICYDWGCGGPSDCNLPPLKHVSADELRDRLGLEPSEADMDYVRRSLGINVPEEGIRT